MTAIYTITSSLHDSNAVNHLSDQFLSGIFPDGNYLFKGADFSSFGQEALNLIYIRTGGAEGIFKSLMPSIAAAARGNFYLLASGESNSLAASLEILSYLRANGMKGEVLHGSHEYIRYRIELLSAAANAGRALEGGKILVIGKPSDWLISSTFDSEAIKRRLGVEVEEVPMQELLDYIEATAEEPAPEVLPMICDIRESYPGAMRIYSALKRLCKDRKGTALTLRCFDLLSTVNNTGCLALAKLNSEGIPSSCEGDVPALLTMMISRALTGKSGFQANPARINVQTGEILFAHCTIPFDMVDSYSFHTHFESGIGVGIRGRVPEGDVTVMKVSGNLSRCFVAEGRLTGCLGEENLCRTQVQLELSPADARYFLTDPIGNHHIIVPGAYRALIEEFLGI
ncbi:MAG: hypothetical protein J5764_02320 [Bacteroidales bacterium]|nr:hypothetical protein [Bacteroidales bacterium]